jgi:hypothetical protein
MTREQVEAALDAFDWDAWRRSLEKKYRRWYRETMTRAGEAATSDWVAGSPYVTKFADRYIGERVTQISERTRGRIREIVLANLDAGAADRAVSVTELGAQIKNAFGSMARSRSQMIARTETVIANNHGTLFGFVREGYNFVLVSDGSEGSIACNCDEVNGQIWPLEKALANPIEHPNCTRSFTPISDEEAAAEGVSE